MASFLEAFDRGQNVGNSWVGAYNSSYENARNWQDKLKMREEARGAAASEADRKLEQTRYERGQDKSKSEFEASNLDKNLMREDIKESNAQAYRMKELALKALASGGRGTELDEYQKGQLVLKNSANFLKARNDGDEAGVQRYGDALTKLGVPLPTAPVEEELGLLHPINDIKWLGRKMGYGSEKAPPASASATVQSILGDN